MSGWIIDIPMTFREFFNLFGKKQNHNPHTYFAKAQPDINDGEEVAPGADAAALAFEALERARREAFDVLVIDTAGRLQNKADLMAELQKIVRVLKKLDPEVPHDTLLTLDATTGQNAHAQVEVFLDLVQVSGLVLTKLDGSARGGVLVGLANRFALPVHLIGVGEGLGDLRPFEPTSFARALLGLPG